MSELVAAAAPDELLVLPRGKVRLHGIDFDEDFLSELVVRHFRRQQWQTKPMFSDAFGIYMRENPSAHRRKFKTVTKQAYALFAAQFGDMPLDELRHVHITEFRDSQLAGKVPQCQYPLQFARLNLGWLIRNKIGEHH